MAKQLNIFVENSPGRLKAVSDTLSKNNINIRAFAMQDRGDFGLLRLIVDRPQDAYLCLAEVGCACALKEILAISIEDRIGNFSTLTSALAENGINIVDAYGFVIQPEQTGVCCLQVDDSQQVQAKAVVEQAGFTILNDNEFYSI